MNVPFVKCGRFGLELALHISFLLYFISNDLDRFVCALICQIEAVQICFYFKTAQPNWGGRGVCRMVQAFGHVYVSFGWSVQC